MTTNMSALDRRARALLVAPIAIVVGALIGPASAAAIVLYAVAAVMLATASAGYCPIYALVARLGGRRPLPH